MDCPRCNTRNSDDSKYCKECSAPLEHLGEVSVTRTLQKPVQEPIRGTLFAGRYQVIEKIGTGGMGSVYRVEDTKIHEDVALKIIKPDIAADRQTIERFSNELKTARKITHKNVCRMYHLEEQEGLHFITMEYVTGEDLKSLIRRVKPDTGTVVFIAKQICEGLSAAHQLGVVHRDLKPSNIMIDKDGNARIMDFGIARTLTAKGLTHAGVMIGTPEYMSPEQAESTDIDRRSDIYSLGVILYEMAAGQVPFEGNTPFDIARKHVDEPPRDPKEINTQIQDELSRLILKCLEKNKENRFESADELRVELENIEKGIPGSERSRSKRKPKTSKEITVSFGLKRLFIPALVIVALAIIAILVWKFRPQSESGLSESIEPSIAVLPFEDLSHQKDQEYFCDGMTDELIAKLSSLEGFKVISRSSVMQYKNTDIDVKKIGEELGVATVIEGSVRKEEDDIRVTAQLVNVKDRFQIWTDTYDQKLEKIFEIQRDIAENIAKSLRTELSLEDGRRIEKKPTRNLEAYKLYLQGRYFSNKVTVEGFRKAIQFYDDAIKEDPFFALAYVGLADSYNLLGGYEFSRPREVYPKARAAALKALEIDERIAEAHSILAWNKFRFESDWAGAEKGFKRALELNANSAASHLDYTMYLLCAGRYDEAVLESQRGLELDPLSLRANTMVGFALFISGQHDKAIEKLKTVLEMNPDFSWANSVLGEVYEQKGMYTEAFASYKKAIDFYGENPSLFMGFLGYSYAQAGQMEEAKNVLNQLVDLSKQGYVSPYALGIINLGLNQKDRAFALFEQAAEEHTTMMTSLKFDHRMDSVRTDPRFKSLLKKMNLE